MGRLRSITAGALIATVLAGLIGAGSAWASANVSDTGRIVGGRTASTGQFPFMAFVAYFDKHGNPVFICSGTLVSSNVVLTAGHCTENLETHMLYRAGGYRIVTGTNNWTSAAHRTISKVLRVRVDPGFDPHGPKNDAGLLVLSKPVKQPAVALWQSGQIAGGTAARIVGWGETFSGSGPPKHLRWAATVVQSDSYCGRFAASNFTFDPASMLCAQDRPANSTATCSGDSGGPLLVTESDGTVIEAGVTSVGPAGCPTNQPDFYTAVRPIYPWVSSQIKAFAP